MEMIVSWEDKPLKDLAKNGELNAYKHNGFWQPMDTLRDHRLFKKMGRRKSIVENMVVMKGFLVK